MRMLPTSYFFGSIVPVSAAGVPASSVALGFFPEPNTVPMAETLNQPA